MPAHSAVIVGVDGSERALDAVDFAAAAADCRGRPLHVVLVTTIGHSHAEEAVDRAVACARSTHPRIQVTGEVVEGIPAAVLVARSADVPLVVVGERGFGGFTGLRIGGVAAQLAAHAACPVPVVRGQPTLSGEVVLGVDGSPAGEAAAALAFEEASWRSTPLTAVHAWRYPAFAGPADALPFEYTEAQVEQAEGRVLSEVLAGWQEKYPDVAVNRTLVHGPARQALITASRRAQLLVVGSRGRGGFAGLHLGSVSQAMLHHAACPVLVAPQPR